MSVMRAEVSRVAVATSAIFDWNRQATAPVCRDAQIQLASISGGT
jgi:hypothetical protein